MLSGSSLAARCWPHNFRLFCYLVGSNAVYEHLLRGREVGAPNFLDPTCCFRNPVGIYRRRCHLLSLLRTPPQMPIVISLDPPPFASQSSASFIYRRNTSGNKSVTLLTPPTPTPTPAPPCPPSQRLTPLSLRAGEWPSPRPPSARPCRLFPTPAGSSGTAARFPDAGSRPRAPHGRRRIRCRRRALQRGRRLSTTRKPSVTKRNKETRKKNEYAPIRVG